MENNQVLRSVAWSHTIFRFFETFFKCILELALSEYKFHDFRSYELKVMGVWSFFVKSGQPKNFLF
jgi:hypothetical protein